jgi:hypothetical protein
MKAKLLLGIMCLAFMLPVPGAQAAALDALYDNGAADSMWGQEMAAYLPAEDFTFASPQTVAHVRFWAVEATGYKDKWLGFTAPDPGVYNGSIVWQIYSNGAGQPGTVLASGTATPTPAFDHDTVTDFLSWGITYQFDFNIDPVDLPAGTYWLALHNGPMTTQDISNFYWESSGTGGVMAYAKANTPSDGTWGAWQIYAAKDASLAFQLYNGDPGEFHGGPVPLPGAVWLLGSGLLGLIGLRKKLRS